MPFFKQHDDNEWLYGLPWQGVLKLRTLLSKGLVMGLLDSLDTDSPCKYSPVKLTRLAETCQTGLGEGRFAHGLEELAEFRSEVNSKFDLMHKDMNAVNKLPF